GNQPQCARPQFGTPALFERALSRPRGFLPLPCGIRFDLRIRRDRLLRCFHCAPVLLACLLRDANMQKRALAFAEGDNGRAGVWTPVLAVSWFPALGQDWFR